MAKTSKVNIPYGKQWLDAKDIKAVVGVLKSDFITQGPTIDQFEKSLAKYVGSKYAVAFANGTAALHGACKAAGIENGDEVIVPTLSFVASANCVLYSHAKPILVDIDETTLTIDIDKIAGKINKKTKAIIAVDFAGHPANWDKLISLARKNQLILISDAAHALGSKYKAKGIGSIADMTVFSFHPVKTITTGEGGAVTTNNKKFFDKLLAFRSHGMVKSKELARKNGAWFYDIQSLGYNYRMTDMSAALGLSQLAKIDSFIKKRRAIWNRYNAAFAKVEGLILPKEKEGVFSAWHLYTLRFKKGYIKNDRKTIFNKLREMGIGVQVHFIPIHLHSLYKNKFGYKKGDFPIAEKYYEEEISLPLFPKLTDREQKVVINSVLKAIS